MAAVHEGMAQVTAALSYIPKGTSSGVSYEFRGIDAVMNHLHGPLAEAGLFLAPRVLDDWRLAGIPGTNNRTQYQAAFRVAVDVYAADGSCVTLGPGLAQSHDYGDKAVYQAQQNAIKYLLLEAFCIPTAEQDMDAREADASPVRSGPALSVRMGELEELIDTARAAGVEGDFDATREWARESSGNVEAALSRLRKAIADKSEVAS